MCTLAQLKPIFKLLQHRSRKSFSIFHTSYIIPILYTSTKSSSSLHFLYVSNCSNRSFIFSYRPKMLSPSFHLQLFPHHYYLHDNDTLYHMDVYTTVAISFLFFLKIHPFLHYLRHVST